MTISGRPIAVAELEKLAGVSGLPDTRTICVLIRHEDATPSERVFAVFRELRKAGFVGMEGRGLRETDIIGTVPANSTFDDAVRRSIESTIEKDFLMTMTTEGTIVISGLMVRLKELETIHAVPQLPPLSTLRVVIQLQQGADRIALGALMNELHKVGFIGIALSEATAN